MILNLKKKGLLILLALLITCAGFAGAEIREGTCGDAVSWSFDDEGLLCISGEGEMTSFPWFGFSSEIRKVIIENGVTSITDYAFQYCDSLMEIILPETITKIGRYAFYSCKQLTSLDLPNFMTDLEDGAFCGCSALAELSLPEEGLTEINTDVFTGCSALTHLEIPERVLRIRSMPDGIETVNLPDSLLYFGSVFAGKKHLKSIRIPEKIESIEYNAFEYCGELSEVIFPEGLKQIGEYAFYRTEKLESVYLPASIIFIDKFAFEQGNLKTIKAEFRSYPVKWANDNGISVITILQD